MQKWNKFYTKETSINLAPILKPPPTSSLCTKEELTYCTHTSLSVRSFDQLLSSEFQPSDLKNFLQSDCIFRIQAFFDVAPCDLVNYRHFRGLLTLHYYKQAVKDPEDKNTTLLQNLVMTHHWHGVHISERLNLQPHHCQNLKYLIDLL